jgi:hypothetical protein
MSADLPVVGQVQDSQTSGNPAETMEGPQGTAFCNGGRWAEQ